MSDSNEISMLFEAQRVCPNSKQSNHNIKCLEDVASKCCCSFYYTKFCNEHEHVIIKKQNTKHRNVVSVCHFLDVDICGVYIEW